MSATGCPRCRRRFHMTPARRRAVLREAQALWRVTATFTVCDKWGGLCRACGRPVPRPPRVVTPEEQAERDAARARRAAERAEMRALITSGYRALAKTAHPDVGGSVEEMMLVTEARDLLLAWVGR